MAQESKYGLIMLSMRENGERTKLMVEVSSGMPMATFTRVNGKKTRQTDMECTSMSMALNTRDTGRTIFKMAKVWRAGKMVADMKVAIRKE